MGNCCLSAHNDQQQQQQIVNDDKKDIMDEKELKDALDKVEFSPHFILMGDSVLDNIAWVQDQDKKLDVEKLLNIELQKYNKSWKCKNLAVDGNTTQSLIKSLNFYNLQKDKQFQPKRFQSLQIYLESDNIDITKEKPIIILSIGGNDVLGYMYDIKQMSQKVLTDMKDNEFIKSYKQILDILINECKCDVIICFVYEPHIRFCQSIERKELLKIFGWASNQIFTIAENYKLPIIDLCRTCNPYNDKHYSFASPIEPNEMNGSFTTNLVLHCLYDFEWNKHNDRKSKIYFGQNDDGNGLQIEENTVQTRANYMQSKLAMHPFQSVKK